MNAFIASLYAVFASSKYSPKSARTLSIRSSNPVRIGISFTHPNLPVMYRFVNSNSGSENILSVSPNSTSLPMYINPV